MSFDPIRSSRGRRALFGALYLVEGAPIGFLWWALPARLRADGLPVDVITQLTATVTLPWVFKFAWAPLLDLSAPWVSTRTWVIACQGAMGLCLLPLLWLSEPVTDTGLLLVALVAHAVAAATQDVAIDTWAIRGTPEEERGRLNSAMQIGKFGGRWLFGAGLTMLAGVEIGGAALALIAVIWASIPLVAISGDVAPGVEPVDVRGAGFASNLAEAFSHRSSWLALGYAAISGAGFEALGAVAGPLLVERGFDEGVIGGFYSANLVAMIAGAAVGGVASDRLGRRASAGACLIFVALVVGAVAGVDAAVVRGGIDPWPLLPAMLVLMYLGYGAFVASSYALFMRLTDRHVGATQFSAYMGATNACEAWAGFVAGWMIVRFGYAPSLAALGLVSLLGLPLLVGMRAEADPEP